jgi:uncharacterized membrane protein
MGLASLYGAGDSSAIFKWTPSTGVVSLGAGYHAIDMSADGAVVVGMDYFYRARKWTASTGLVNMAPQPHFAYERIAAVSGDGKVVVGSGGATANAADWQPFLWSESAGYTVLPGALDGIGETIATQISDDHSTIAGVFGPFAGSGGSHVFRWTLDGGYEDLGGHPDYPEGEYLKAVIGISGDGKIIIGRGFSLSAFIWEESQGMLTAREYFFNHGIDVPDVNNLAVSRDGQKFFGTTFDGRAFIATIPEPGSTAALLLGAATIFARRRPSGRQVRERAE